MKKKLMYIILFIVILITHFYSYYRVSKNDYVYGHYTEMEINELEDYVYRDEVIVQKIAAKEDNFYKVKLYLNGIRDSVYENDECKELYAVFSIEDENHNVIEKYKVSRVFLEEDGTVPFVFKPIEDSKGKIYYLKLESYKNQNINMKFAVNNTQEQYEMWIDDKLTDNSLLYLTSYKTDYDNSIFLIVTFIISCIFISLTIIFIKMKFNMEKQYLFLAICISFLMIFLSSPFAGHDEISHWGRVYELSRGNLISDVKDDWLYASVPNADIGFGKYSEISLHMNPNGQDTKIDMQYTSVYSPISYLPQIIGLNIAKVILPNSFYWSYFVRITQAIFCIICTYFAIKWIPVGKKIVFFIGLLPTYIQATSLISADACLVSSSILFIAKILQVSLSKDKIKRKDYILLFILSATLALSKLVYIPLCLLLLFIPYKRKEGKKEIGIILILTLCITILWNGIALNSLMQGQGGNTSYYIKEILTNPIHFLQITFYSFFNQIGNHISDLFGGQNRWQSNIIYDSTIIPLLFFILYIYLTFNEDKDILNKKEKRYLSIILIITYVLISTSLYISCTPIYHDEIIGIQGRYLLPFLLPIYFLIPKGNKKTKINLSIFFIFMYFAYYLNYIIMYV